MEALNASALSGRLVGIIWGDAKVGKTTWACSLSGRKLIINFDPEGFSSIAHRTDVDVIDLSKLTPTEAMREAGKAATYIIENADKYETIILDSLTTLVEVAMHDAIAQGLGKSQSFTPTIDAPGLAAYGGRNNRVNEVISKILRATGQKGLNCFLIAHQDDPEFSQDGKTVVQQTIMLSAKIRNTAALKVSEVYYLGMDGDRRTVYLAPHGVKKPMGSRIFDTSVFKKFPLDYDITKSDDEQQCSLQRIVENWKANGFQKLKSLPN